jgi:hypothetical protein
VKTSDSCTDTFQVYQSPAVPVITPLGPTALCVGDTLILLASEADNYRWFNDTSLLGDVDSFLVVTRPGKYVVEVKNTGNSCTALSDTVEVEFQQYPVPPVISLSGGSLTVSNPNNYAVKWYDNGVEIVGETDNTLDNPSGSGPFTASFTTTAGCSSMSQPFLLCITGQANTLNIDTVRCCSETPNSFIATASGFSFGNNSVLAWGITPASQGPINSDADAQTAHAAGNVFVGNPDNSFDFSSCTKQLEEGLYYLTPFVIDNPSVDPLLYDTLNGCRPDAQLCPAISGTGWIINPLIFGFPDGTSFNVNQQFIFGADINETLWATLTANGPFCLALSSLFSGNPNGTWTISVTNIGTGNLDISVPAFEVRVSADSCAALNGTDQVVVINQVTATVAPGQTKTIVLEIPPLPANFPSVNPACSAFGSPVQFYYKACEDTFSSSSMASKIHDFATFRVYPNPNKGQFTLEYYSTTIENVEINVLNNLGQKIYSDISEKVIGNYKKQIDISNMAGGIYLVHLKTPAGQAYRRILIE